MSRGFLSGVLVGGVVGSVGLALASQMARPPGTTWPEAAVEGPAADAAASLASGTAAAPEAAGGTATGPSSGASMTQDSPGPATDLAPPPGSEFARPLPEAAPVLPSADTAPARAVAPSVSTPELRDAASPDTETALRPQPVPLEPIAPAPPATEAVAPSLPTAPSTVPLRSGGAPLQQAPDAEPETFAVELPPPPPLTPEEEAMLAGAADGAPVEAEAPAEPGKPRMLETDPPRVPSDGSAASRLPRIGDPAPEAGAPPAEEAEADLPPIRRYAQPFENPDRKPLFAVLLRDTGGPSLDREALAGLAFPVTFVIDPSAPDAATAAEMYRKAGHEVLMLATGLPEGAKASDVEVTLEAAANALPEAVGVIDLPAGGFQDARPLSTQVVEILKAQGRGLVTHDRGLNAAEQVARREDLPSALVFRMLDGEGADPATVRRVLDRAAFKAAQEGRVAVYGDTRPETVQGLLEWSVEGRADAVALAPVTALMR
ncbi:divergent polysaccharide deacetylase family protein [Rhodobacter sp. NSM]|uniref:divergent polysaccharide deacetylase family protein n=1 Tax=Rhodobacter sp. NSM TaxID=3457501 RepID=UPI003FD4E9A5